MAPHPTTVIARRLNPHSQIVTTARLRKVGLESACLCICNHPLLHWLIQAAASGTRQQQRVSTNLRGMCFDTIAWFPNSFLWANANIYYTYNARAHGPWAKNYLTEQRTGHVCSKPMVACECVVAHHAMPELTRPSAQLCNATNSRTCTRACIETSTNARTTTCTRARSYRTKPAYLQAQVEEQILQNRILCYEETRHV